MDNNELANLRQDYQKGILRREDLPAHPFLLLTKWLNQAKEAKIADPNAFVLSTIEDNTPHSRIVLMKGIDMSRRSITFFTNYQSNKAQQLEKNPNVSVLFPWYMLERQVIASGTVKKIESALSKAYFYSRPKESQLAALASNQSQILPSKQVLLDKFHQLSAQYQTQQVPFPEHWGGFEITIHRMEFWQGGPHRLHDRFKYQHNLGESNDLWEIVRLSP